MQMNDYYISPFDDKDYELFLQNLMIHFNLDLRGYKQHRLRRRTDILLKNITSAPIKSILNFLRKIPQNGMSF